jgi:plastocyanin
MKKAILIISLFFGMIASGSGQTTYDVSITDYAFSPIGSIAAGDIVRWTNNSSSITHSSTSGTGCSPDTKWSFDLAPGASMTHTFSTAGSYSYYCRFHCPTMTGTITVTAATGISNPKISSSLNIFPNPFTDVVTLSFEQGKENVNMIKVTDAVGKEVKNIEVSAGQSSYSFDLSDLQPGMYFCNLYTSEGIVGTKKIFRTR